MLTSTALALASALPAAGPAQAQDATWLEFPFHYVTGVFNVGAYWDTGVPPAGTAYFGPTATPNIYFINDTVVGGWTFNQFSTDYAFTNQWSLQFNGAGIGYAGFNYSSVTIANSWQLHFNNSSSAETNLGDGSGTAITNSRLVEFHDQSTAGSAAIENNDTLNFHNTSTAGTASITNNASGNLNFNDSSTAGSASIANSGTANFNHTSTAGSANITNNASANLNFNDSSSADSATINNSGTTSFNNTSTAGGANITNNSSGTLNFNNSSSAGSATIANSVGATLGFYNTSTAGTASITNSGTTNFNDTSTAGSAGITNNASGTLNFNDSSTAGSATIANSGGLNFNNTSTAGTASITNSGTANFNNTSTAGNATITNNNGASLNFYDTSTGDDASINNSGTMNFRGASTAGSAAITSGHVLIFYNASTAGSATITNTSNATFFDSSSAGSAAITNHYSLNFANSSTAGSATIINNYGLSFNGDASAGSATITSGSSGHFGFYGTSTAGSASITNSGSMWFNDSSTAGNASIGNSGTLTFYNATTAGNATITNNGGHTTEFRNNSTAGNAQLINNGASALFDFSASIGPNGDYKLTAGSIAGNGTFNLGDKVLTVGGNNLSTTVSGVISGTNGALVKTGTGTMTLTGSNTYSGGTTISGGTLQIGDGGTDGSITGNVANDSVLAFSRSDAMTFAGTISGSGAVRQIGTGTTILTGSNTYSGGTTISAGTLQIGDGGASGSMLGAVTVGSTAIFDLVNADTSGITTISNNGSTNFRNGTSAGSANIINNNLLTFYSDASAGSATFTNNGIGSLYFYNTSTAGSAAIANNSILAFHDTSTAGSAAITNNGGLYFSGTSSAGSASITNNNLLEFYNTSNAGNAAITNIGGGLVDFSGSTGLSGDGRLSAGSIAGNGTFSLGANELTVGSNNLSTDVSGVISGTGGSLVKVGTGTLTLSDTNSYTGATTINGGTLAVNGSITSSSGVTVNSGGALGGAGIVGHTTIASGGALAPGNSIGTLTVSGNLAFSTGAAYMVEVSPTAADRTNVTGTATLTGATVQAIALPGSFRAQTYTILNATGGFGGTQFAGITGSSFAPGARNPHLTYDANNAYLVLDPGAIQLPASARGNEVNVADGINKAVESGATPPAAFDALLNMTGAQLTNALNQVSGQPATGGATSGTQMTTSFLTLLLNPNAGAVGGSTFGGARSFASEPAVSPEAASAYAAVTPKDKRLIAFAEPRWSVWGQVYGGYNKTDGDTADTIARTWGLATGFDYRAAPDLTFGFALAGGSTNWGMSQGLGGGKSDVLQLGVYGRKEFGPAYLSAALSYAWHNMSTDRTVTVSGSDKLAASFDAHSFGGRLEAGYRFALPSFGVTPYAALQVQNFRTPSYGESATSGSNAFALSYDARSTTATRTELGAWFDNTILLDRGNALALHSRAAWAYDHSSDAAIGAVFQTLPGSNFSLNGAQAAPNALLASLGAELRLANSWSIGARFDGEFASGSQTYAGTGTVRYAW